MGQTNSIFVQLKRRMLADLKRDVKRTALMLALLAICLVLVIRLVLGHGPAVAASPTAQVAPQYEPARPAGPENAVVAIEDDQSPPADGAAGASKLGVARITRDLFRPDPQAFPVPAQTTTVENVVATTNAANQDAEAQARRNALVAQAQALQLAGTVVSASPVVMINGQVLGIGDKIEGFRVVRITSDGCIVEKDGEQIALAKRKD